MRIALQSRPRSLLVVAAVAALLTAALVVLAARPAGSATTTKPVPFAHELPGGHDLAFPPDTNFCITNLGIHCYQPAQLQKAYNLSPLFASGIDGSGETIVIVDAFGSPTIQNDVHVFDQAFGLPDPTLNVYQPAGAVPPFDPTDSTMVGWATETTLDVEWAHAFAPGARIALLETPVAETEGVQGFPEIVAAENWAIDHGIGDVISMSFGATEQTFPSPSSILGLRSAFVNAHAKKVALVSGTGDAGATNFELDLSTLYPMPVTAWPATDPLVTAIGGTQLDLDLGGNRIAPDVVWNDGFGATGGGLSTVFDRPDFQAHLKDVVGKARGVPDVSSSAAVDGAVDIYFSFDPSRVGWHLVGGTSESSPEFAGVVALADQMRGGKRITDLSKALYKLDYQHGLVDVTTGDNSFAGVTGFAAGPGYDLASGLGTFDASALVPALAKSKD